MTIYVSPSLTEFGLAQLRTQIQHLGYGSDTAPEVQNTMLNMIYRRVLGMRRWWFLQGSDQSITTESGTRRYTLDDIGDLLHIDAVRIESSGRQWDISYLDPQALHDVYHTYRTVGEPQYWTRVGSDLIFHPTPNGAYSVTIDYIKDAAKMSDDDDTPVIPEAYQDILVWGAVRELCFRERDPEGRAMADDEFQTRLRDLIQQDGLRQRQNSSQVRSSGDLDRVNTGYFTGYESWRR